MKRLKGFLMTKLSGFSELRAFALRILNHRSNLIKKSLFLSLLPLLSLC